MNPSEPTAYPWMREAATELLHFAFEQQRGIGHHCSCECQQCDDDRVGIIAAHFAPHDCERLLRELVSTPCRLYVTVDPFPTNSQPSVFVSVNNIGHGVRYGTDGPDIPSAVAAAKERMKPCH